jgi:type VI secretion system protein ImpG
MPVDREYQGSPDPELLRHYYERELERLRRDMQAFAARHPQEAARLSVDSHGHPDNPEVERLMQGCAFTLARTRVKLADDFPEFTEALQRIVYPQYLRPFPSYSVVQFETPDMMSGGRMEPVRIARGTELVTQAGQCRFRTGYDVVLAPLRIAHARYADTPTAPLAVILPEGTSGMLSVTFQTVTPGGRLDAIGLDVLRVYLAGAPETVATVLDTMLTRTAQAYVEDSTGRWTPLDSVPVTPAGLDAQDVLLPGHDRQHGTPFWLLAEYFAFAERFSFVDIDFATPVRVAGGGERLTLHLAVRGVPLDSRTAQRLALLSASDLKLSCTPVVNLFARMNLALRPAVPGATQAPGGQLWPVGLEDGGDGKGGGNGGDGRSRNDAPAEVWTVDRVRTEKGGHIPPYDGLGQHGASAAASRWILMQRSTPEAPGIPRPAALGLVHTHSGEMRDGGQDWSGRLVADLTCSNGDLPYALPTGAPGGDMQMAGKATGQAITLLHPLTPAGYLPRGDGALWRLIRWQMPKHHALDNACLASLKEVFRQFAPLSARPAWHIDGIRRLASRCVMQWVVRPPQPAMVRGIGITLVIDEAAFAAHSIAVFAGVMEGFFRPYAFTNSFIQLAVQSAGNGRVIWQGRPLAGTTHPV